MTNRIPTFKVVSRPSYIVNSQPMRSGDVESLLLIGVLPSLSDQQREHSTPPPLRHLSCKPVGFHCYAYGLVYRSLHSCKSVRVEEVSYLIVAKLKENNRCVNTKGLVIWSHLSHTADYPGPRDCTRLLTTWQTRSPTPTP